MRTLALVFVLLAPAAFADVNLATFGADPTGEHDSGPALQSALNTLGAEKGTVLYIPPGVYRIHTGVTRNFNGNPSSIVIRGEGSASVLKIELNSQSRALQFRNLESIVIENVTLVGSHADATLTDALYALDFESCRQVTMRHCDFYGVTTVRGGSHGLPLGAVVYAYHSDLRLDGVSFYACGGDWTMGSTPFDGTPVIDNDDWLGFTIADSSFLNRGTLNGVVYTQPAVQASSAWVRLRTPAPGIANAASGHREVVIRDVRMDDAAYYGVAVRSGLGGERAAITISGLNLNGYNSGQAEQGTGVWIAAAENVRIERSWFGWSQYASKYAIELLDSGNALLDGVVCDPTRLMRKIRATGVTNLTIRNSSYASVEGSPLTLNVIANEQFATSVPGRVVQAATIIKPDDADQVLILTQGATLTLPNPGQTNGRTYTIKNENVGTATVYGSIEGATSKMLVTQHAAITVTAVGGSWYVVSQVGTVQ